MKLIFFSLLVTFGMFSSCSINSVGGNVGNALIYNDTLVAPVQIQLIDASTIEYELNNLIEDDTDVNEFQFNVQSNLNIALAERKIEVLPNDVSTTHFVLTIERISYVVSPNTDTFKDDDNTETLVDTKDYSFEINAQITAIKTGKKEKILVNLNDATHAGKTLFGTIGEKGSISREEMMSRGIERFVGKLVKELNKMV